MKTTDNLDSITPEEALAFVQKFCRKYSHAAQEVAYSVMGGASRYELLIKPRGYETLYDELETRFSGKGESRKKRRGRYPEYIRDIHQTFEELLGIENSMPFKVGNNKFLALNPANISISEDLAKLKIT